MKESESEGGFDVTMLGRPGREGPAWRSAKPTNGAARERQTQLKDQGQRRMLSYVVDRSARPERLLGQEEPDDTSVDAAGVQRVLDHERAAGRHPVEQEHSNPGFDVDSFDDAGTLLRRIEIKSTAGPWGERGVALSRRQYAENERETDLFWLYVVEYASDEACARVHRLHNPAADIGAYFFDEGWRAVAEPDPPPVTVPSQIAPVDGRAARRLQSGEVP